MALIGDPIREREYEPVEGPLTSDPPAEPAPEPAEVEREEVPA